MKTVERALCSVGKAVFVVYHEELKHTQDKAALAEKLKSELQSTSLGAQRTRVSNATWIFEQGKEKEALEIILASDRLDPAILEQARRLYDDLLHRLAYNRSHLVAYLNEYYEPNAPVDLSYKAPDTMSFCTATLDRVLEHTGENLSQMLLRLVAEKGMTDPECYSKANVSRSVWSNIHCKENYRPQKPVIYKLAVALKLSLSETEELMKRADHAFDPSNRLDLTMKFFIERRIYDTVEIDDGLIYVGEKEFFSIKD